MHDGTLPRLSFFFFFFFFFFFYGRFSKTDKYCWKCIANTYLNVQFSCHHHFHHHLHGHHHHHHLHVFVLCNSP